MGSIESVKRKGKAADAIIESKDQRWHCRNRITLVFGSNDIEELETYIYEEHSIRFQTVQFHQAKSKAIEEILDNCIDEHYRGHVTEIHTYLSEDCKTVEIEDNGIGFPLDKIPQVYAEFRTGSKFKDEETDEKGFLHRTLGQNGLGAAATCLTSDEFKVTVRHYNSKKEQTVTFIDGALKVNKSKPKPFTGHSGVRVSVTLAKEVYKNAKIDPDLLRKRIIDLAYNNPGLTFFFNKEKYLYKKGLLELAERIDSKNAQHFGDDSIIYETENIKGKKVKGKIDISLSFTIDKASDERERFISFVNSTPTYDGGFHHDKIKRIFINTIKEKLERQAKKDKLKLIDNDVLTGLTFIVGITMPNPRFESQTKRKLVRDAQLEKVIDEFMSKHIEKFIKKNKEFLEIIIDRASSRHKFQDLKDAASTARKQKRQRVEKLLDANERKKRDLCTLFICEGDSAIGGLRSARNKLYQGGIALRGKPMNVAQASIQDILNNQEFLDIMTAVGLVLGQEPDTKQMRFSNIVFLADSDVDGGHINTLLTNFFFQFWPSLFTMGVIQIAKAPLFEVLTDKKTHYFESEVELEEFKKKGTEKIREIFRNKGLGEMSPEAWKWVLSKESYTKITIETMANARQMLNICFGKDANLRKDLLMDSYEGQSVNVNVDSDPTGSVKKANAAKASKESKEKTTAVPAKKIKPAKVVKKAAPVKSPTKKKVKPTNSKKKMKADGERTNVLANMVKYLD